MEQSLQNCPQPAGTVRCDAGGTRWLVLYYYYLNYYFEVHVRVLLRSTVLYSYVKKCSDIHCVGAYFFCQQITTYTLPFLPPTRKQWHQPDIGFLYRSCKKQYRR